MDQNRPVSWDHLSRSKMLALLLLMARYGTVVMMGL